MTLSPPATAGPAVSARRLVTVRGVVQGVGFRPFVYALARGTRPVGARHQHR